MAISSIRRSISEFADLNSVRDTACAELGFHGAVAASQSGCRRSTAAVKFAIHEHSRSRRRRWSSWQLAFSATCHCVRWVGQALFCVAALAYLAHAEADATQPTASTQIDEGETLKDLVARIHTLRQQGKYLQGLPLAQQAAEMFERVLGPNHAGTAAGLDMLAGLHRAIGQFETALPLYQRALAITEKAYGPEHPSTGTGLNNLAALYLDLGRYEQSLPLFQRALVISEKAEGPESSSTGRNLNNLASLYEAMGHYEQALQMYERALAISEKTNGPEHPRTAASLNNLANVYRYMGRYGDALPLLQRALTISEIAQGSEPSSIVTRLVSLAALYRDLGSYAQALSLIQRALAITETVEGPDHPSMNTSLRSLARLYQAMGLYEQAVTAHKRVLAISEKSLAPDHPDIAGDLSDLATVYLNTSRYGEAEPLYQRALGISEKSFGPGHPNTGTVLNNLGAFYQATGRNEQALPLYLQAAAIGHEAGSPELRWKALGNLMALYSTAGDARLSASSKALAIWYGKQAVNTLQSVRSRMHRMDRNLQSGFLNDNQRTYERLANLLIDTGRLAEAEQVLAMIKQRELFELTRSTGASTAALQTSFDGVERAALEDERRLAAEGVRQSQELNELERQLKSGGSLSEAEDARRQALLSQAQAWRAEYQRFLVGLFKRFAQATRTQSSSASAREADQQSTRLQARVALDPAGAVGLHYLVADEQIGIIVATSRGSFGRFSHISRAQLESQIAALRQAVFAKADTRPASQALWRMLIEPVHADIQASGAQTLVLSLTDNLRYLPFAALQAPDGRYLVQDYALAVWAAAADVKPRTGRVAWHVAGLGLSEARHGFSALPAVPGELASIVRTSPADPDGVLPGTIALDQQFTRQRFEQALSGRANVLHVASHFDFKPGDESRSVLVLGQGEPISLGQLAVMDFSEIEQLTLSACDTATGGGVNENGAEVEGLAAIVLRQRAGAVLATLWKVADPSTAKLMRDFYAKRSAENGRGVSRAQALRQAQLAMLQGAASAVPAEPARGVSKVNAAGQTLNAQPVDPARPWAHPFYWAPFVLSGNWL